MAWSDEEGSFNIVFLGDGRVEWMRKRQIREDGGNWHEKLGLQSISRLFQFTIPIMAGVTADPPGKDNITQTCITDLAGCTPDFSYWLVSSISYTSSFPISLSRSTLYHHHRTQSEIIPIYLPM